jgi:hypothetical protein
MQDSKSLIPEILKQIVTYLGGTAALLYALGFVVVTTYMLNFGVTDISLAQAQYISVGLFFIISAAFTLLPTAWLTYILMSEIYILMSEILERLRSRKPKPKKNIESQILKVQMVFYYTLIYVIVAIFAPFTLFHLTSDTGTGSEVISHLHQDMTSYFIQLWDIVPDWFAPLIGLGIFIGQIVYFVNIKEEVFAKLKHRSSIIMPESEPIKSKPQPFILRTGIIMFFMVFACMIPYLGLIATHTYSAEIYPAIRPGFGGGNFGTIQFVTDSSGANVLSSLVRMESTLTSEPVQLIGDGAKYYSILLDTNDKRAVMIEKSLVKGIKSMKIPLDKISKKSSTKENVDEEKPSLKP